MTTTIVIAKQPVPGRVKTRLTPPLRPDQAADVAAAALADTLAVVAAWPDTQRVLAFDGDPTQWTHPGWTVVAQASGSLDQRLEAAFTAVAAGPALLVGMDTPQLTAAQLGRFDPSRYDACLGLAPDGGYWAIGFGEPDMARSAIVGVPMSTERTGAAQLARLLSLGLRVQLLDELTDVDTIHSAHEVARLAPDSRFARALAAACASLELSGAA